MKAIRIITGILQILHSLIFIALGGLLLILRDVFVALSKAVISGVAGAEVENASESIDVVTDFFTNNTLPITIILVAVGIILFVNSILIFKHGKKFRPVSELVSVVIFILLLGSLIVNQINGYINTSIPVFVDLACMLVLNIILLLYYIIKYDGDEKKKAKTEDAKKEENENAKIEEQENKNENIQGSYVEEMLNKVGDNDKVSD